MSLDSSVPPRVRQRAQALRLSARDWTAPRIAEFFHCHEQTVRETFCRWWSGGLEGLFEAEGRGMPTRWKEEDIAYLEQRILADEQSYNSQQLSEILLQERSVQLSAIQLRKVLKKRASSGNEHARVLLARIRNYRQRKKSS